MRIICFLLLCLSYSFSYSQETHTYRELYIESFDKEDACNSLNTIWGPIKIIQPVVIITKLAPFSQKHSSINSSF